MDIQRDPSPAPLEWAYSFLNGQAVATFPGQVVGASFVQTPGGAILIVSTFASIAGINVPPPVQQIQTVGYSAVGVGGALYNRVAGGPASAWRTQSADGQWWTLAPDQALDVTMFGVVFDATGASQAANSAAYTAALAGASTINGVLRHPAWLTCLVQMQNINAPITLKLEGTLKLANAQNTSVINLNANNITIEGSGTIDGNKANQTGGLGTVLAGINANCTSTSAISPLPPPVPNPIARIRISGITITNCFNWPVNLGFIDDCIIERTTMSFSQNSPQFVFQVTNSWMMNNIIHDITDGAFVFYQGCKNCGAIGNSCYNCADGIGVYTDNSTQNPNSNILISGNIVHDILDSGISVTTAGNGTINNSNVLIIGNTCWHNNARGGNGKGSLAAVLASGVVFAGNYVSGDGSTCTAGNVTSSIVITATCQDIICDGNVIGNVGSAAANGIAINQLGAPFTSITNNIIYDNQATKTTTCGISGVCGSNNVIANNRGLLTAWAGGGFLTELNLQNDTIEDGQQAFNFFTRFTKGIEVCTPTTPNNNNPTITSGAGAPSAVQPNGSIYLRTDGAANTRLYVSNGATWAAIASS